MNQATPRGGGLAPVRRVAAATRWLRGGLVALTVAAVAACGGGEPPAPGRAVPADTLLTWSPVAETQSYVVRAWSGYRLLFEEAVEGTTLVLTPSLRRALDAFDTVEVELVPRLARGSHDATRRWRYKPAS